MTSDEIARFVDPVRVYSCEDVLTRPFAGSSAGRRLRVVVPNAAAAGGGRWLPSAPGPVAAVCGDQPEPASPERAPPSKQTLRDRIKYHYTGNAEGSTLRKTLGCLLADDLGIELRRVGSGRRMTFVEGEQTLSAWMAENAYISWVVRDQPWELEDELIA